MPKELEPMTFLIVDSNPAIAEKIMKVTCATGLCKETPYMAHDSQEAMELMRSTTIDFIIVDHDNLDFVKVLRSRERFKEVPVLLAIAPIHTEDALQAIKAGIDQFIQKPLVPYQLLEKITTMVK